MQSTKFRALVLWWIFGSSVFQLIYGYEVSIFIELSGSNAWNGSVLSAMLLTGTFGALLPSWLRAGEMDEERLNLLLMMAGVLAFVSLLISVKVWQLATSITALTFFFFFWQFIDAVFYTRLALTLSKTSERRRVESTSSSSSSSSSDATAFQPTNPPYSIAVVLIVSLTVLLQLILLAILFSSLQQPLQDSCIVVAWLFGAATLAYIVFSAVYRVRFSRGNPSDF